jgi:Tfp pilus assembly protein PilF
VTNAPQFGFGWARVAELEFSFGHTAAAQNALDQALQFSPRHAPAIALQGFVLAAQNRIPAALLQFDRAIAQDAALGNAWLGRGLCRIRAGRSDEGLRDLMIAASLESQRSVLRSYLGKAFAAARDERHATRELALAKQLDPSDPTPWLYSALLNQTDNRINEAVADLERSQELNDNRRLFRSRLLLDQDRAVRSANLAAIYRDAGMFDVSVREASRAVTADYGNYSAHEFLANSYNELRDPNLINLRYETPTFSEYLVANLLAPVGATPLSPQVSQQEYSRLFERDGVGLSSSTTYTSRGDWQQDASQFGTLGNTGYALDTSYRSLNGQYRNNDLWQFAFSAQLKQQLTPQDSIYFQTIYNDLDSGDLRQYYDPASSSANLRVHEEQAPNLFLGYHHEWSPGVHTLFLAGRLDDTLTLSEPNAIIRTFSKDANGQITAVLPEPFSQFGEKFRSEFEAYTVEIQQIWQLSRHTLIAGARFQTGDTETRADTARDPNAFPPNLFDQLYPQRNTTDLERLSFYAYDNWRVFDPFWLIAGVSYDRLRFPENIDSPPISSAQSEKDRVLPKVGFIWMPDAVTSLRFAYTRSLGGLFYDQSVRLEPTQVAGFNQAFRSLIPESIAGPVPGSEFETFHLGGDRRFATGTYVVLDAAVLQSLATRTVGVFSFIEPPVNPATPEQIREKLDYEERSLTLTVNQLVGDCWSLGSRYRLAESELELRLPQIPNAVLPDSDNRAVLHQLNFFAIYNHPCGFFAQADALWWAQDNLGDSSGLADDDFWQFNLFAGYRFARRRAELTVGVLNLTDQDYRLNPLSLYGELPRERTFVANFKFNF